MNTRWTIIPLIAVTLTIAVPAAAAPNRPQLPELSEREETRLRNGQSVLHRNDDAVVGVIEIETSADELWKVLVDYNGVAADDPVIRKIEPYHKASMGTHVEIALAFHLKVMSRDVLYHLHHQVYEDDKLMVWELDSSRDNDMELVDGAFTVWPGSTASTTRLLYRSKISTGAPIPDSLEEEITATTLRHYLKDVKARAERASARNDLRTAEVSR